MKSVWPHPLYLRSLREGPISTCSRSAWRQSGPIPTTPLSPPLSPPPSPYPASTTSLPSTLHLPTYPLPLYPFPPYPLLLYPFPPYPLPLNTFQSYHLPFYLFPPHPLSLYPFQPYPFPPYPLARGDPINQFNLTTLLCLSQVRA